MKCLALDGNSLAYRAFFALPSDMATSAGQITNAVVGFTSMLVNLVKDQQPDSIIVVFDRPEKTFRHEAVPEYKAQREAAPDALRSQMGIIRELLDALGIAALDMAGFEGDDIIATLARMCRSAGDDIVIVTGDRDSYQLVSDPHVKVLYNKRGVSDYALYDEAGILERTGVVPSRYVDYAALRGDPSDNLVGANGVGEKTAAKLVNEYPSLTAILDSHDKQTPKLKAALEEGRERVLRNASVMVLRDDLPVDVRPADCQPRPDWAATQRLLDFLEMRTMSKRLREAFGKWSTSDGNDSESTATGSSTVSDSISSDFERWSAKGEKSLAKDIAAAASVAIWDCGDAGAVLSIGDDAAGKCVAFAPQDLEALSRCLVAARKIVAHDAKPLWRRMLEAGLDVGSVGFDTAIAAYLLEPVDGGHRIDRLVAVHLEASLPVGAPESNGELDFGGSASGDDGAFAAGASRARAVAALAAPLEAALETTGMKALFFDVEMPLVGVLARMEVRGIGVDTATLDDITRNLTNRANELTALLHGLAGRDFNLNSPTQLQKILFDERGLSKGKKTKTGYSTDAATLEKLRDEWPEFIDALLEYREVEKLRGTYGEGLRAVVARDGRIHAVFNQTVARTGRLSSENPNLHNIPVRSDMGKVFRTAFVAGDGCELLVADYNQIELRCIAHLAADPGLIAAFNAGVDIHSATASRVFGVDAKSVSADQRSKAKMVSYGLAYGMEAYGLSQRLAIDVPEATEILDAYFAAFPAVRAYMDRTVTEARNRGYTETLFGRRRPIPELTSDNFRIRQAGERQAMNAGIQGLAADIFKIALVRIDRELETACLSARLVLQVHDEVIVESPVAEKTAVEKLVLGIMRGAAELAVPLEVNAAWGRTWADAK
ncbi:MAG: DNA polymerase I [Acidobacteria bacterium]|nr:DNA polymerase I [Acidobacteriota bacterium]